MGDERPIGPTQAFLIPFHGPAIPAKIRHGIEQLQDGQSEVRLLEVLVLGRGRDGVIERRQPGGLRPASALGSAVLEEMLDHARSRDPGGEPALSDAAPDGWGLRLAGDPSPDLGEVLAAESCAILLLVELRWAIPLRDTMLDSSATLLANLWWGRWGPQSAGLIQPRTAMDSG